MADNEYSYDWFGNLLYGYVGAAGGMPMNELIN
ncbi:MAG: hypothetical protein H6766_04135 [Candidatus Peribacteria bacterium]|nr:MAG: hypothetical protein H6766_04135 [Candidatus Peribacteria bacterium]